MFSVGRATAQNSPPLNVPPAAAPSNDPAARAEQDLNRPVASAVAPAATSSVSAPINPGEMNLWELYVAGGIFMIPITIISFIALAYMIERAIGLRTSKVVPPDLVQALGEMSAQGGFDPRRVYRLCQEYPSTLSNVLRAMLLKVGRPLPEVEQAVKAASDAEATKLYANVRPIALAVTIEPMLGLLGTVQGIIMAFGQMSNASETGGDRTLLFAAGIYTALITTFGGLLVAIPAAIVGHYFEGLILKHFQRIDDVVENLLPQVERFEGKLRVNRQQLNNDAPPTAASHAPSIPGLAVPVKS